MIDFIFDTEEVDGSNPFGPTILLSAVHAHFSIFDGVRALPATGARRR